MEYLATVPEDALESAGTRIVVIGCGEWNVIESYTGQCVSRSSI